MSKKSLSKLKKKIEKENSIENNPKLQKQERKIKKIKKRHVTINYVVSYIAWITGGLLPFTTIISLTSSSNSVIEPRYVWMVPYFLIIGLISIIFGLYWYFRTKKNSEIKLVRLRSRNLIYAIIMIVINFPLAILLFISYFRLRKVYNLNQEKYNANEEEIT